MTQKLKLMELTVSITICILLLLLTPPLPSSSLQIQLTSSHQQGPNRGVLSVAQPRKLMLTEKVPIKAHEDQRTTNTHPIHHIGTGSSGDSAELEESELLTMDYPRFKKRRPVHNKFQPVRRP